MMALLTEARDALRDTTWPATRTPPPQFDRLVGIETRPHVAALARAALGDQAQVISGDVRGLTLPDCSAVLIFDVLQMLPRHEQEALLASLRDLPTCPVLLIREADASAEWRFALVRLGNRLKALAAGSWRQRFAYRTRAEWLSAFAQLGFETKDCGVAGDRFGNVLFRVTRPRTPV